MDTAQYQTTTVEPKEADQCSTTDVDNEPTTPVRDLSEEPLTENPFDSESSRILFDAIDQLQSCDAGQDIDIPQVSNLKPA